MRISKKLPLAAVSLTLFAILVGAATSLSISTKFLQESAQEKLQAIADGRRNQLETYLHAIEDDVRSIATNALSIRAVDKFAFYFPYAGDDPKAELQRRYITENPHPLGERHKLDAAGTDGFEGQHEEVHGFYRDFVQKRGYNDLFLIAMNGDVVYSVNKTNEFATNLAEGEWKDTGLGEAWRLAMASEEGKSFFIDYSKYGPKNDIPASFITQAIFKKGRLKGVLVLELPSENINRIVSNATGLGETGETLLLKSDGTMISDSAKTEENEALSVKLNLSQALLEQSYSAQPVDQLEGYRGESFEISAVRVDFADADWIVGALISSDEVFAGVTTLRNYTFGISLLLIAISMGLAFLLSSSITRPIGNAINNMKELASGNTEIDLDGANRKDEIGEIFQSVGIFRDAAIEKDRLEAESEKTRVLTEQERQQAEELKAQNAAKIEEAVEELASGLTRLSDGDLTIQLERKFDGDLDRIRTDFNTSVGKLSETLGQISKVSTGLHVNSTEISNATNDLSQRTETQAASLEETAAALDEITATVKRTVEKATDASKKANDARHDTAASSEVVANAVAAMNGIEKASNDINQIINVIDEIAFQTNLLALNAGVEAARAGEAGKGFAVVAQEVRELAGRSAEAAKQIKVLISASENEVSNGVRLVKGAGEALEKISKHVTEIDDRIGDISKGASEQLEGIQEVNSAVNSMDRVTQQNAAMVEENTAVTHEVSAQVNELNQLLSTFQTSSDQTSKTSIRNAA